MRAADDELGAALFGQLLSTKLLSAICEVVNMGGTSGVADAICVWLKTSQSGGQAFAVVEVDSPAPEAVLQEIKGLKEVEDVRGIRL